jgi:hypothetical protein
MASKKWVTLPGGRVKRWKKSRTESPSWLGVPPRWYRNLFNRKERRRCREALGLGHAEPRLYVHPRKAVWYW